MPIRKRRESETEEEYAVYLEERRAASAAATQRWREAHPERMEEARAAMRAFRAANPLPDDKREARRISSAQWRARNPDRVKENARRLNAKLREERPEVLRARRAKAYSSTREAELQALGNPTACGVCGVDPIPPKKNGQDGRYLDHRHDTGEIRGVVCSRCNRALGVVDMRSVDPEWWAALLDFADNASTGRKKPRALRPTTNPRFLE